jgi:dihydroxyacetone synthase
MSTFGKSLPGATAYEYFGFNGSVIAPKAKAVFDDVRDFGIKSLRGEFRDLNSILSVYQEE